MEVFNRCENSNNILLAVKNWESVHPLIKMIPVEWNYGIIYKNLKNDWENLEYGVAMKKFRKIFRDNIKLLAETYNITFSKEIPKEY